IDNVISGAIGYLLGPANLQLPYYYCSDDDHSIKKKTKN
ncbi:unnamed protein product, partial [Rotaria sp. Silwood2]